MNLVETRLRNQQLVRPRFTRPEEVVSFLGAVQAQEYRLVRWAVAMRTRKPSLEAFAQAYNRGDIVRIHLQRGTWQLVSREDYGWMMRLFAPRSQRVINGWMAANHISVSDEEYAEVGEILARTAGELRSATKEDFARAVAAGFGPMDDHRLSYHIRHGELTGLLCSGDLLPMKASYSLVSEKLGLTFPDGMDLDPHSRSEALERMARIYFQSRSPATLEDFVWWSGLGASDCRKGMAALGDALQPVRRARDPREFHVLDTCEIAARSCSSTLLLAPFDEYLIGYKSRDLVLDAEHTARAHNNSGNFSPIIAVDGHIAGNWHPFSPCIDADFFRRDLERDLTAARDGFRQFRLNKENYA